MAIEKTLPGGFRRLARGAKARQPVDGEYPTVAVSHAVHQPGVLIRAAAFRVSFEVNWAWLTLCSVLVLALGMAVARAQLRET